MNTQTTQLTEHISTDKCELLNQLRGAHVIQENCYPIRPEKIWKQVATAAKALVDKMTFAKPKAATIYSLPPECGKSTSRIGANLETQLIQQSVCVLLETERIGQSSVVQDDNNHHLEDIGQPKQSLKRKRLESQQQKNELEKACTKVIVRANPSVREILPQQPDYLGSLYRNTSTGNYGKVFMKYRKPRCQYPSKKLNKQLAAVPTIVQEEPVIQETPVFRPVAKSKQKRPSKKEAGFLPRSDKFEIFEQEQKWAQPIFQQTNTSKPVQYVLDREIKAVKPQFIHPQPIQSTQVSTRIINTPTSYQPVLSAESREIRSVASKHQPHLTAQTPQNLIVQPQQFSNVKQQVQQAAPLTIAKEQSEQIQVKSSTQVTDNTSKTFDSFYSNPSEPCNFEPIQTNPKSVPESAINSPLRRSISENDKNASDAAQGPTPALSEAEAAPSSPLHKNLEPEKKVQETQVRFSTPQKQSSASAVNNPFLTCQSDKRSELNLFNIIKSAVPSTNFNFASKPQPNTLFSSSLPILNSHNSAILENSSVMSSNTLMDEEQPLSCLIPINQPKTMQYSYNNSVPPPLPSFYPSTQQFQGPSSASSFFRSTPQVQKPSFVTNTNNLFSSTVDALNMFSRKSGESTQASSLFSCAVAPPPTSTFPKSIVSNFMKKKEKQRIN